MTDTPPFDFSHLTPDERISLAQQLWDSVGACPGDVPMTDAQKAEVERRWAAYRGGELAPVPWADIRDTLMPR